MSVCLSVCLSVAHTEIGSVLRRSHTRPSHFLPYEAVQQNRQKHQSSRVQKSTVSSLTAALATTSIGCPSGCFAGPVLLICFRSNPTCSCADSGSLPALDHRLHPTYLITLICMVLLNLRGKMKLGLSQLRSIFDSAFLPFGCDCELQQDGSLTIKIYDKATGTVELIVTGIAAQGLHSTRHAANLVAELRSELQVVKSICAMPEPNSSA